MTESGFYPPGAEHDPRAPYNQPDTPECVSCGDNDAFTRDCTKHAGPVCPACRCPDCPPPSDMEPDEPDPPEPDTPTYDLIDEDDPDA